MKKYIAHNAGDYEFEEFDNIEDAENHLRECEEEGFSEEFINGRSYIAEVILTSGVNILETKQEYHNKGEEWPYDDDWSWMGEAVFRKV